MALQIKLASGRKLRHERGNWYANSGDPEHCLIWLYLRFFQTPPGAVEFNDQILEDGLEMSDFADHGDDGTSHAISSIIRRTAVALPEEVEDEDMDESERYKQASVAKDILEKWATHIEEDSRLGRELWSGVGYFSNITHPYHCRRLGIKV